jgi:hypothetical protein
MYESGSKHTKSKTESNGNVFSYVGNQVRRIVIPKTNPK